MIYVKSGFSHNRSPGVPLSIDTVTSSIILMYTTGNIPIGNIPIGNIVLKNTYI